MSNLKWTRVADHGRLPDKGKTPLSYSRIEITGNREGLEDLRDAINLALANKKTISRTRQHDILGEDLFISVKVVTLSADVEADRFAIAERNSEDQGF